MRPTINLSDHSQLAVLMEQNSQALEGQCYIVVGGFLYYVHHGARVVSEALREEYERQNMPYPPSRSRVTPRIHGYIFPRSAANRTALAIQPPAILPTHQLLRIPNLAELRRLVEQLPHIFTQRDYVSVNNALYRIDHGNRTICQVSRLVTQYWQHRENSGPFQHRMNHPEQLAAIAAIIFPEATDTDSSDEELIIEVETSDSEDSDDDQPQAPSPAQPAPYTTVVIDWRLAAHIDLSDTTRVPNFTNHMAFSVYLQHHPTGLQHHSRIAIAEVCYKIDHSSRTVTTEAAQAAPSHYQHYLQQQLFPAELQPSVMNIFTGEAEGATASGLSFEDELEEGLPWEMVDVEDWLAEQPEALDVIPIESLLVLSPADQPACSPDQQERQAEDSDELAS